MNIPEDDADLPQFGASQSNPYSDRSQSNAKKQRSKSTMDGKKSKQAVPTKIDETARKPQLSVIISNKEGEDVDSELESHYGDNIEHSDLFDTYDMQDGG